MPDCLTRISHTFFVRQTSNSAACMPAYLRATHNQVRCSARAGVASNSAGCGATIAQTSKSAASRVSSPTNASRLRTAWQLGRRPNSRFVPESGSRHNGFVAPALQICEISKPTQCRARRRSLRYRSPKVRSAPAHGCKARRRPFIISLLHRC